MPVNRTHGHDDESGIEAALMRFVKVAVGPVRRIERVRGGLVHRVYKVHARDIAYLKVRGSSFAELPSLRIEPRDIAHEKMALEIFSKAAPDHFPKVLGFDADLSAILMTDSNPSGHTLSEMFARQRVTLEIMENVGKALGKTHAALKNVSQAIRPDGDDAYRESNLNDRLLKFDHPPARAAANRLADALKLMPLQLISADMSPKNIGVDALGNVGFFDLECAHLGNVALDLGFLVGHLALHTGNESEDFVESMLRGYRSYATEPVCETTLKKVSGLTMLYRLRNAVIPYPLSISAKERDHLIERACNLLRD